MKIALTIAVNYGKCSYTYRSIIDGFTSYSNFDSYFVDAATQSLKLTLRYSEIFADGLAAHIRKFHQLFLQRQFYYIIST